MLIVGRLPPELLSCCCCRFDLGIIGMGCRAKGQPADAEEAVAVARVVSRSASNHRSEGGVFLSSAAAVVRVRVSVCCACDTYYRTYNGLLRTYPLFMCI